MNQGGSSHSVLRCGAQIKGRKAGSVIRIQQKAEKAKWGNASRKLWTSLKIWGHLRGEAGWGRYQESATSWYSKGTQTIHKKCRPAVLKRQVAGGLKSKGGTAIDGDVMEVLALAAGGGDAYRNVSVKIENRDLVQRVSANSDQTLARGGKGKAKESSQKKTRKGRDKRKILTVKRSRGVACKYKGERGD